MSSIFMGFIYMTSRRKFLMAGLATLPVFAVHSDANSSSVKRKQILNNGSLVTGLAVTSTLSSVIETEIQDVYILLQGDSTGNQDWEFFRQLADKLCVYYPRWGVSYVPWEHSSGTWGEAVVVQAGTNGFTIYLYNGSHPGAVPSYWRAGRADVAYDGQKFDLILSNFGLNAPTSYEGQVYCLAEYLMDLRHDQPNAEVLVILQPPDYNNNEMLLRSRNRVRAQRWVAAQYGCQTIDVYGLFLKLVQSTGGPEKWYLDKIHPNKSGQDAWADLVFQSIMIADLSGNQYASELAPVTVPNGVFQHWPGGSNVDPLFWNSSGDVVRDTSFYESDDSSARFIGHGIDTGTASVLADDIVRNHRHLEGFWAAARVRSVGASTKPGTLFLSRGSGSHQITSNRYVSEQSHGGWRWVMLYVPRSFTHGYSEFRLGVYTGEQGEHVSVDRILISASPVFADYNGDVSGGYRLVLQDSSFDIPAGGAISRTFLTPVARYGAKVSFRTIEQNPILSCTASVRDGEITLLFANPLLEDRTQAAYQVEFFIS
ncbi:SGNH/GDSL hydrolase family protein [Alcaligenes faecalis]|nr:SGNH/GDSL hydrolase family protein [Alcaligenes faecalis]